ncbi:hypothetical protein [Pseudomonas japonica]|uniref:Uncharacterized protein n=1 Tax=Pseudomonas japonica TaxID=256466 RepID=A0A239G8T3_9PSED|nr:hypothetical protein [Pseudomonas japonica]SNS65491.1 hypothetical protein SAMN05444352_11225 [Pseudomonas japonica]
MPISNKDVIEAFIEDFQSMHESNHQPNVKCDFDGDPAVLAEVANVGGIPTLRFSYRFADDAVSNHADLFYCLIIAGHELAHWANAHTKHLDKDDLDSKAIEMWADFFGSRLVLTAVARCQKVQTIIRNMRTPAFDAERENALLPAYGEALRRVYDRLFAPASASPKYPSAIERVQICGAGVTSFFYRHLGKMHQGMTVLALRRVILEPFADIADLFSGDIDLEESGALAFRNIEIHLGLKKGRPLITPGILPQFNQLVGTHYLGHSENMAHREQLREKVRAWGVEI